MAKKIKKIYSKTELMNITATQLSEMKAENLRYVVSSMNRIIRRQQVELESLIKKNPSLYSPALEKMKKRVPEAYTQEGKLKSLNQLRHEFKLGQDIMKMKSYETSKVKSIHKKMKERLEQKLDIGINPKEFWSTYNKFSELYGVGFDSDQVQTLIAQAYKKTGEADPVDIYESLIHEYEEKELRHSEIEKNLLEGLRNGKKFKGGSI